jgi:hypothetical protein
MVYGMLNVIQMQCTVYQERTRLWNKFNLQYTTGNHLPTLGTKQTASSSRAIIMCPYQDMEM